MSNIPLTTWFLKYDNGMFASPDVKTQIKAGWYDWFCRDSSLKNRMDKMVPLLRHVAKSKKIDPTKTYVFFKNNFPMAGPLYDDFRICDLETGDVLYTVIPKCTHSGKAEVWGTENNFDGPIVAGTRKDIKNFFAEEELV
jgi:hypothetical protein